MEKFGPLVKRQIEYWLQQIEYYPPTHLRYRPQKVARYKDLVRDFGRLLERLNAEEGTDLKPEPPQSLNRRGMHQEPASRRTISQAPPPIQPLSPAWAATPSKDDLSDLPAELLAELSGGAKAEADPLIQIINNRGGTATLDEILIDLYRNFKEVGKRNLIGNKLYRLGKRDLVWSVPGRKGIYTTTKPVGVLGGAVEQETDNSSEDDEGPDAATSGPSNQMGAAGSPVGLPKSAPNGSIPFASTPIRRKLMSETSALANRLPFEQGGVK